MQFTKLKASNSRTKAEDYARRLKHKPMRGNKQNPDDYAL